MTAREEDRQVALLARALWLRHGGRIPVDIAGIASVYAFTFDYRRAPLAFRGALFPEQRLIVINANLPACQQRYVIVHELAHWLVAGGQVRVRPARLERACQLFAAHLLMPPDRVAASARAVQGRADLLEELAAEYLVTPSTMRIHLKQLGLLPGGAAHTLEQEIVALAGRDPSLAAELDLPEAPVVLVPLWTVDIDAVYRQR